MIKFCQSSNQQAVTLVCFISFSRIVPRESNAHGYFVLSFSVSLYKCSKHETRNWINMWNIIISGRCWRPKKVQGSGFAASVQRIFNIMGLGPKCPFFWADSWDARQCRVGPSLAVKVLFTFYMYKCHCKKKSSYKTRCLKHLSKRHWLMWHYFKSWWYIRDERSPKFGWIFGTWSLFSDLSS